MAETKTRTFRLAGDECPNGKAGDCLRLYVRDEQGTEVVMFVEVAGREEYPHGHGLHGKMVEPDGMHYLVEITVYDDNPRLSGVRVSYDMARNT